MTSTIPSSVLVTRVFGMLEAAAAAGARCPINDQLPYGATKMLACNGRIRIEVYAHNWRVVEILEGPHKGKRTMEAPSIKSGKLRGARPKPYLVSDRDGIRRYGEPVQTRHGQQAPSIPFADGRRMR